MTTPEYPPNQPPYEPAPGAGYPPPAQPPYGAPTTPPYQPPAYGAQPPVPPYGAQPPVPPYGAPASAPPYGTQAPVPPYGAPASAPPYGTQAPIPPYGAPASAPPYGAPASAPPYGQPQGLAPQFPPGGAFPGVPTPPAEAPKKKGAAAKILSVVGVILVVIVIAAVRFGLSKGADMIDNAINKPSNPFEGTPAADFAQGEAGIKLPTATAVPGFTVAKVDAALQNVKKALIAGRLDKKMLIDHDRSAFDPLFSKWGQGVNDDIFNGKTGSVIATWIAPGYSLTNDPIRDKGEVTFKGGQYQGVTTLVVHTNFVWVYPFTGDLKSPGDHLVMVHDQIDWTFPAEDEVTADYVGMFVGDDSQVVATGVDCGLYHSDLIALGKPVEATGNHDSNSDFDPNSSMNVPDALSC